MQLSEYCAGKSCSAKQNSGETTAPELLGSRMPSQHRHYFSKMRGQPLKPFRFQTSPVLLPSVHFDPTSENKHLDAAPEQRTSKSKFISCTSSHLPHV